MFGFPFGSCCDIEHVQVASNSTTTKWQQLKTAPSSSLQRVYETCMYLSSLSACHSEESKRDVEKKGIVARNDGPMWVSFGSCALSDSMHSHHVRLLATIIVTTEQALVVFNDYIYRTRDFSQALTAFSITEEIESPILLVLLSETHKSFKFENGFDMAREHRVRCCRRVHFLYLLGRLIAQAFCSVVPRFRLPWCNVADLIATRHTFSLPLSHTHRYPRASRRWRR